MSDDLNQIMNQFSDVDDFDGSSWNGDETVFGDSVDGDEEILNTGPNINFVNVVPI